MIRMIFHSYHLKVKKFLFGMITYYKHMYILLYYLVVYILYRISATVKGEI